MRQFYQFFLLDARRRCKDWVKVGVYQISHNLVSMFNYSLHFQPMISAVAGKKQPKPTKNQ
ncbi:MAG: hypothetical protein C4583_05975 [Anaerolineaceae bacterium]|nr:MAG: hypothetical protein C4583_05975 [Anaerolineaceae bacterium]